MTQNDDTKNLHDDTKWLHKVMTQIDDTTMMTKGDDTKWIHNRMTKNVNTKRWDNIMTQRDDMK